MHLLSAAFEQSAAAPAEQGVPAEQQGSALGVLRFRDEKSDVGSGVGEAVGSGVGWVVGIAVGWTVGIAVGFSVGDVVVGTDGERVPYLNENPPRGRL